MQHSYSPYQKKHTRGKFKLPNINLPKNAKIWLAIIAGTLFGIFFIFYLALGELRFFANHYLGLSFFSKSYLIVLQNNYELRPTGGFVTGFGKLNVFMGFPSNIEFKNSYDIDTSTYVTPPYPHEDLLKNEKYEGYTFRDANWNPNFPDSAKQLIKFYEEPFHNEKINGVVAINFSLIEDLINKLGNVKLNGKIFTKENLFSELQFSVNNIDRHNIESLKTRRNILGELANALSDQLKKHPFKTKSVLINGLKKKDIFIWLKNERLQRSLVKKNWANTLTNGINSDFLAVNLANLGSKKADRYVQSEINYFADISKEVPKITTEFILRYPGSTNYYSDNYKGYLRLYIPKNANTETLPVDTKVSNEGEFTVLGTKVILPAGGKTSLTYTYSLPRSLFIQNEYQLKIATQSGTSPLYKIMVEAENGKVLSSNEFETRENQAKFMGQFKEDQLFNLKILNDQIPAYPIEQQFIALDEIEIIWNEPINELNAQNPENYLITDLNKVSDVTDEVRIASIYMPSNNVVQLKLEGVTKQNLEAYLITLKNIKDQSGNLIVENPKTITAIQRIKPKEEAPEIKLGEIPNNAQGEVILNKKQTN